MLSPKDKRAKTQNGILKGLDAPAEVILVDPITVPIARVLAQMKVHPISITFLAFLCRVAGAVLFATNKLVLGAILSILGFYLDGIDGKVARLRHLDEELHGTTDFMLDQLAFALMDVGAAIWAINNGHILTAVFIISWLALYCVFLGFTSTMFRILSQRGIRYQDIGEGGIGRDFFTTSSEGQKKNGIVRLLARPARIYFAAKEFAARFRMSPYFGAIESEIAIFMIAPLFGFNDVIVLVAVALLLPDTLFTTVLIFIKVLDARRS